MDRLKGITKQLRALLRKPDVERELDEELEFHLAMEAARLERDEGLPPDEALRRARLAFGGVERFKEDVRDARWTRLIEDTIADLRYAARGLRRTPGFAAAAILTLGIGIGASTAVFSLVNATLFRPLPFPQPDRLVTIYQVRTLPGEGPHPVRWSYGEFEALRRTLTSTTHLSAYYATDVNLSGVAEPVRSGLEIVSASYFTTLGVQPALGRAFLPHEDSVPGAHPVAVLGHALWERELSADPAVLGRVVHLNGVAVTVVGVMPAGFDGLSGGRDVWIPSSMAPEIYFPAYLTSTQRFLSMVGRLGENESLERARAEVAASGAAAAGEVRRQAAGEDEGLWSASLAPLDEARRPPGAVRAQLVLAGAVSLVLLIGAINLAGLLLARSVARTRESAIRAALGGSRLRLVRQALVESSLIGLLGGALGLLLATWGVRALVAFGPERLGGTPAFAQLESFSTPSIDLRVLAFAAAVSLGAGLLAGLFPALRQSGTSLTGALRSGGRGSSAIVGTIRRPTVLSAIAVAQVACALVLLVGAGLLLRGFERLRMIDPGFDPAGVVSFRLAAPDSRYAGDAAAPLIERILERVEAIPGVTSATVSLCTPLARCSSTYLHIVGRPESRDPPLVGRHYVGPEHFATLGIPLLRGRALTENDRAGRPRVAVINERAARRLFPGEDPIGQRVWFTSGGGFASPDSATQIVGIVGDVLYGAPGEEIGPDFYTSYRQFTWARTTVMARTSGDPLALVPAMRAAVAEVDPDLPIYDVRTLADRHADSLHRERFAALALAIFALLGLILAAVGIYGVMAYSVAQRRQEIGIRLALGAAPGEVVRQIVARGMALAGAGLALGAAASLGFARLLSALVSGVESLDPVVLAAVAALLMIVALLTTWLPARAAARIDPVQTLGME